MARINLCNRKIIYFNPASKFQNNPFNRLLKSVEGHLTNKNLGQPMLKKSFLVNVCGSNPFKSLIIITTRGNMLEKSCPRS